jgi:hypothetical protein
MSTNTHVFENVMVFDPNTNARRILSKLEKNMLSAISSSRVRARILFKRLEIDEREGKDALRRLIDNGFVAVSDDWSLYIRKEVLGL